MKRSLNEIGGMVLKAARGAGIPLGHCEDLAAAATYLGASDPTALECVLDALQPPFTRPAYVVNGTEMRITAGATSFIAPLCVDALRSGFQKVEIEKCDAPQLVLSLCAAQKIGVGYHFEGAALTVTRSDSSPDQPASQPAVVSQSLWDALDHLASKTYVPATDASRQAGAGADLNDND